jgi:hypothetical protein
VRSLEKKARDRTGRGEPALRTGPDSASSVFPIAKPAPWGVVWEARSEG